MTELYLHSHYVYDIAVDNTGNIVMNVSFYTSLQLSPTVVIESQDDIVTFSNGLVKLDANANIIWAYSTGLAFVNDIVFDNDNNIYLGGFFFSEVDFDYKEDTYIMTELGLALFDFPLNYDGYIQKLDSDANFIWAKQLKNPYNLAVQSITLDIENNVYTSGVWQGSGTPSDLDFDPGPEVYTLDAPNTINSKQFIHKLNTSGDFQWVNTFGPWLSTPDYLNPEQGGFLSVSSDNDLYYAGDVKSVNYESFVFGENSYIPLGQDILLGKLNKDDGAVEWSSMIIDNTGFKNVYAANIIDNNWVISGTFQQDVNFNLNDDIQFPVSSNGFSDFFVMKIDLSSILGVIENSSQTFNIYPNPTSGFINIKDVAGSEFEVTIYNINEQLMLTEKGNKSLQVNLEQFKSGLYFLTIKTGENTVYTSKIIKQ